MLRAALRAADLNPESRDRLRCAPAVSVTKITGKSRTDNARASGDGGADAPRPPDTGNSDAVTASSEVGRCFQVEYDLSWRPIEGSLYKSGTIAREIAPEHRETLDERASRLREGWQS